MMADPAIVWYVIRENVLSAAAVEDQREDYAMRVMVWADAQTATEQGLKEDLYLLIWTINILVIHFLHFLRTNYIHLRQFPLTLLFPVFSYTFNISI